MRGVNFWSGLALLVLPGCGDKAETLGEPSITGIGFGCEVAYDTGLDGD